MSEPSDTIERHFRDQFSTWAISLPEEAVRERRGGHLFEGGWHIGFIWGRDGDVEYLEYLAQHRMSEDLHVRAYEDGRVEELAAASSMTAIPRDASAEEIQRAVDRAAAERRRINAELRELGLLPPRGRNRLDLEINERLRAGERGEGE